jgi:hypothetical protein
MEVLRQDKVNQYRIQRDFFRYFQRKCIAYDDTVEVLTALKRKGKRICVLTDVPFTRSLQSWLELGF